MTPNAPELTADRLRRTCDPARFSFASTAELSPLEEVIGQARAVRAIEFGIDIESPGFHLYALGPAGTGKTTAIRRLLEKRAADRPSPQDWLYVNNFEDPERPRAIPLPAGMGGRFRDDMAELAEELAVEVPRAFEGEEYQKQGQRLQERFQEKQRELMAQLSAVAEEHSFRLLQTPGGVVLAPVVDGDVVTPDRFEELEEETRQSFESQGKEIQGQVRETLRRIQRLQRSTKERMRELDRKVASFAVGHLIDDLKQTYAEHQPVVDFLEAVRKDMLDKVHELKQLHQQDGEREQAGPFARLIGEQGPSFDHYRVNLVVDHGGNGGAPVVLERNPTSHNLVGRIEHEARFGALVTNFSMIRAGALHRANGGYLLLEARDLLIRPFAWGTLKRVLQDKEIKIETMAEDWSVVATRTLKPEPIPLDLKVVLVGDGRLYYLLFALDEDFCELFKVKADFAVQMDWSDETAMQVARFIAMRCMDERLRHFDPSGVARVVEHASRMVSDQRKLATRFGDLVDLLREASYWAGTHDRELVCGADVSQAIEEKTFRSNRIQERIREMITDGTILVDTEGEVVGQINGLSVLALGDYAFGRPSRITASTHVGSAGVVNIEREVKMGGRIHNKGVMILAGFLGSRFAQDTPLSFSASLTFEQLYEGVEGDSASSAELYALLSSLSGLPLRQDLAVTGSVNQRGQIQAIGGVNEKIEGFFDVCSARGLTGSQGVLIPASNVEHVMLRADVVDAVREGRFHIHPVHTVEEGISLLTGRDAGARRKDGTYAEGTVFHAATRRLQELARKGKEFAKSAAKGGGEGEDDAG
jgi:lon-related putative ATP-dependent protease